MTMQVNGGNEEPISQRYTMESLKIKKGSYEASIFHKIDLSDGQDDGFLTEEQYQRYMEINTPLKAFVKIIKSPFENIKRAKDVKANATVSPDAEQAWRDAGSTSVAMSSAEGLKKLEN